MEQAVKILGMFLPDAVQSGDLDYVVKLINIGADVNSIDSQDKTPLMLAIEGNCIEIAKYLILETEADVNAFDNDLNTAWVEGVDGPGIGQKICLKTHNTFINFSGRNNSTCSNRPEFNGECYDRVRKGIIFGR